MNLKSPHTFLTRGCLSALCGAGGLLAAGSAPTPAAAEDAAYVGVWGAELRCCGAPPANPNSPMEMSDDGYDQHLTHCAFKSVEQQGSAFKVAAECLLEDGTVRASQITLVVSGNTLSFTDEAETRDYQRCR